MADSNDRGDGAQLQAASATSSVKIAGQSKDSLTRLAEKHAGKIVQAWKDVESGKEVDHNDTAVQLALEWLEIVPFSIHAPNVDSLERASEAYWILWAHTKSGGAHVKRWQDKLPGLGVTRASNSSHNTGPRPARKSRNGHKRDSGFGAYEVQRFLREILTEGTKLNLGFLKPQLLGFTAQELIAMALLTSPDRTLAESGIVRQVNDAFKMETGKKMSSNMRQNIESVVRWEEILFDNNFVLVGYVPKWQAMRPLFRLPAGQENKILRKWYSFGPGGYSDGPTLLLEDGRRLDSLPNELKLKVVEYLLKFDTKIHIVRKMCPYRPSGITYDFGIERPGHLIQPGASLAYSSIWGPSQGRVWMMDTAVFALASTSRTWRAIARQVFFGENRFAMGPFVGHSGGDYSQVNTERSHFQRWFRLIGAEAQSFLRYKTFDELPQ